MGGEGRRDGTKSTNMVIGVAKNKLKSTKVPQQTPRSVFAVAFAVSQT